MSFETVKVLINALQTLAACTVLRRFEGLFEVELNLNSVLNWNLNFEFV